MFYDLDTPVTLASFATVQAVDYLPVDGLGAFDLVLSYTGGEALDAVALGARRARVAPLYGSVDPDVHRPVAPIRDSPVICRYFGTYAADRQAALERLFIEPARPARRRSLSAGRMYPATFRWTPNMFFLSHLPPGDHPGFFCSSSLTLNITRGPMARDGLLPVGPALRGGGVRRADAQRLLARAGAFFEPGEEILIARYARMPSPRSTCRARSGGRIGRAGTRAHAG